MVRQSVERLIIALADLGVELWVEAGQLHSRAPKEALTPILREQIRTHKDELIAFLSQRAQAQPVSLSPLSATIRSAPLPLSFVQQSLWLLEQINTDQRAYNEILAVQLDGPLQHHILAQALAEVVCRHEALRTTFNLGDNGIPQQIINPPASTLPLIDLSYLTGQAQADAVQCLARQEAATPFDLAQGPLLRVKLLRLHTASAPPAHVLLIAAHHLILDAWSFILLLQEVETLYTAFVQGKPSPLPALPVQYADYAIWQQAQLTGDVLQSHLAYWQTQLAGAPALLPLPTDRPRPAQQRFQGHEVAFSIDRECTQALRLLAQQTNTTLFMVCLAAFNVLLARYSQQDDIVIGAAIANRQQPEVASLLGYFANTIVLRTQLAENPTFRTLLAQVRTVTHDAYAHQEVSFEQLVAALQPVRNLSYPPLFQVMFVWRTFPSTANPEQPELQIKPLKIVLGTSKYDLTLSLFEREAQLIGGFEYNTDLFDLATIQRMVGHFQTLVAGIVANPDQRIGDLPLLTATERHQLLVEWNNTQTDYPKDKTIHQLFEEQVERTPDAVAVVMGVEEGLETGGWRLETGDKSSVSSLQSLTYRELNACANQLAHYLQTLGVGPEVLVGLCVERSLEMIVGLLGILKAGGAYVPMDPTYPPERLAFMVQDTAVSVLLTQAHLRHQLPATAAQVVCLDQDWPTIASQTHENGIVRESRSTNPAYVMYTSGSSGQPKGVSVVHHNVVRLVKVTDFMQMGPDEIFLQFASISFDAATLEIWAPLLNGGRLVLMPPQQPTLTELGAAIRRHQVTSLWLTAGLFHLMVDECLEDLRPLRQLLAGGDVLSPVHVQRIRQAIPTCQLINGYGPTENTTFTCCYPVPAGDMDGVSVPIGRPIANTQVYLLDSHLQPVPVCVFGELYAGGDGVARGYHNRPALTAEKFIQNPFGGGRLYKTGDRCRWLPNGNIEFWGRIDQQVKIRGFRIELGEIETVLMQHPTVQEAAVIAREDTPGEKQLVAYVVTSDKMTGNDVITQSSWLRRAQSSRHPVILSELCDYLRSKLPDYMVPSVFMALETLPLTANGKVDRKALPAPDRAALGKQEGDEAPQNAVEALLAEIWCNALRLKTVGRHDNFFEIGGDSIITLQVINQARRVGIYLKPRQIFEAQTVAELAEVAEVASEIVTAHQQEESLLVGSVPLLPIQHWFFAQHTVNVHHFNQAVLLPIERDLDTDLLCEALAYLVQQHDALRLRFTLTTTGTQTIWHQHYAEVPGAVNNHRGFWREEVAKSYEEVDVSQLPSSEQAQVLQQTNQWLQRTLNISTGPLWRVARVHFGATQPDRLLFVIHHLAVDFVSWRILLPDLWLFYDQLAVGQTITLPAKGTSYRAWSQWLHSYAQSETVLAEMAYWQRLAAQTIPALPVDYPIAAGQDTVATAALVQCRLSTAETAALLQDVPAVYHTQINDLLLTALVQSFAAWTGERGLLIDLEGHGREELHETLDLAHSVGWFTSLFPLYLCLPCIGETGATENTNGSAIGEAIKAIKEQNRQIPQHGIGYGLLRYLNPETAPQLATLPQAQVSFNYGGQFSREMPVSSLGGEWEPGEGLGYRFNINGAVIDDQLSFTWLYSQCCYRRDTVERLAQSFIEVLQTLIEHCQSPEAGGYTPSDFPLAQLDEQSFAKLAEQIRFFNP